MIVDQVLSYITYGYRESKLERTCTGGSASRRGPIVIVRHPYQVQAAARVVWHRNLSSF
jgi:hypothetical protein